MRTLARRAPATIALCACCVLLATRTAAQVEHAEPASVRLDVPDCLGVSGDEVRRLVALELAPRLRVDASDGAAAIVGSVTCGERVQIVIDDPERASPLQLALDLASAPEPARARLLALSIAELIATSRLERSPELELERAREADAAASSEPASEPARAWRMWLGPGLSRVGSPAVTLLGIEGGASYALGPVVMIAELQARWGDADTLAAEVGVRTYSAALLLSPRLSLGAFDFTAAPGVRLGHARLVGRPERAELRGEALSGVWFGPLIGAAVQYRFTTWAAARAALELGYVARPVRGLDEQSRRLLELEGAWASASLGAALLLP